MLPTQQEGPLGWCWQSIRGVCGISGLPEFLPQHLGWFVRNVGLFWVSVGTARVVSVKEIHSIRLETLSEAGLLSNLWLRHSSAANRAAQAALLELVARSPWSGRRDVCTGNVSACCVRPLHTAWEQSGPLPAGMGLSGALTALVTAVTALNTSMGQTSVLPSATHHAHFEINTGLIN